MLTLVLHTIISTYYSYPQSQGSSILLQARTGGWGKRGEKKSLLLATVKFEPAFFTGCLAVFKKRTGGRAEFLPQPLLPPVPLSGPRKFRSYLFISPEPRRTLGVFGDYFIAPFRQPFKFFVFVPFAGRQKQTFLI